MTPPPETWSTPDALLDQASSDGAPSGLPFSSDQPGKERIALADADADAAAIQTSTPGITCTVQTTGSNPTVGR